MVEEARTWSRQRRDAKEQSKKSYKEFHRVRKKRDDLYPFHKQKPYVEGREGPDGFEFAAP
jgi:hypothetical protein